MMQIFKPLSNMLDLKFFENSARNMSPTYLCKHMTFFLVWAFGQCNITELSHGPSFIYSWYGWQTSRGHKRPIFVD